MTKFFSKETNFFGNANPEELIKKYGTPLYVYNEKILRQRCKELINLITYPDFKVTYSIKANSNIELLRIVHNEGIQADAMSPGEIHVLLNAGFKPDEIFYISNNVSEEEMQFAIDRNIMTSVDSLSQLEMYGRLNPGGSVAIRFNPGVGAGHHEKVVTAGKKTKFGVNMDMVDDVKKILEKYHLRLAGINQHIGSLFMDGAPYVEGVKSLLSIAEQFEDLDFVDMGGGFGISYYKQEGNPRLDLVSLGQSLDAVINDFTQRYGKKITIKAEPGRYVVAESCILLGKVHAVKQNYATSYVGTDLGFNVLIRPAMYDSHHEVEVYHNGALLEGAVAEHPVTIVGNICETGDIIARERMLPAIQEGDVIGMMDAGAYGYSMSSNYNNRLRPAEVLIKQDGSDMLIRRRDTLEDIMRNFI